jgi:rhodanese-related sulfurtransferase
VAKLAAGAGIDAVNIDGGMIAWQRAGLPSKR